MFDRIETYIEWLMTDPVDFLIYMAYTVAVVLSSLILHEVAHGYVALRCGDPTAKMLGRLSLNPARHLHPVGTVCMFLLGFGWAKPVPVNPYNFRNGRRDDFLVSIAGITVNMTLFLICSALSVASVRILWNNDLLEDAAHVIGSLEPLVNVDVSTQYNFAQIIAYGGQFTEEFINAYMAAPWMQYVQRFLLLMAQVNLTLAVFNLLPIPPLDGYHLVNDTLLQGRLQLNRNTFQIAQGILVVLCLTGVLTGILSFVTELINGAVVRTFLFIFGLA